MASVTVLARTGWLPGASRPSIYHCLNTCSYGNGSELVGNHGNGSELVGNHGLIKCSKQKSIHSFQVCAALVERAGTTPALIASWTTLR
jgi:hypothetical protein